MVNQTLEDRVSILRESFGAGPAPVLEVSGAFQVDFDPEQRVYAYVETYDGAITARYETKEADPEKRRHAVEKVQSRLQNEIRVAQISGFTQVQLLKDLFVYTARIDMDPAVFYHQTIFIGEAEMEVPVSIPASDEKFDGTFAATPDTKLENLTNESPIAEVIKEMEAIDAKILRQGLDMMNLKRSSTVRIALTRIFRSVGDAEEVAQVIQQEAGKIISMEDREDLRMVQVIHADGFLKPVINLLYEAVFDRNKFS
ncbi:MAG: hypothetical protein C4518_14940 [Desulfobacteraceae bacterium]|nr:MAG: hypothetical protein C4518_14940 [Desulfobacteraceae bacterium]